MKLGKLWKVGAVAAVFGVVALVAAACAGSQTVTVTPQTVTVTPKVSQTLILQADTVVSSTGLRIRRISVSSQAGSRRGKMWSGASRCMIRQLVSQWMIRLELCCGFP